VAGGRVSRRNDPQGEPGFFKTEGLTTEQLRQAVTHARQKLGSSERRTCRVVGFSRSTHQYQKPAKDEDSLRLALIRLAKQYGRYGYRNGSQPSTRPEQLSAGGSDSTTRSARTKPSTCAHPSPKLYQQTAQTNGAGRAVADRWPRTFRCRGLELFQRRSRAS